MNVRLVILSLVLSFASAASAGTSVRDFRLPDYGTRMDGSPCTEAIRAAIASCGDAGGGRVVVPAGTWFTGPVRLTSNVELHLEEGAKLVFSDAARDYLPAVRTSWEGTDCLNYSPLVYAVGCTNVAITGKGMLAPRLEGWQAWRNPPGAAAARQQLRAWSEAGMPVAQRDLTALADSGTRPHLLQLLDCRSVRLEGFAICGSPFWTIHVCRSEGVAVRGLRVSARSESGIVMNNSDGIDIEMTKDVVVEDCTFAQGDDAIVLKSGRDADGRRIGRPTENVLIRNCTVSAGHVLLGIGSELSGGIRNVRLENCTVDCEVKRLFYVKTNPRRGSFVENIVVDGVKARKVTDDLVCILTRYFYGQPGQEVAGPRPYLTRISGIRVANVSCEWAKRAVTLICDPDYPAQDIRLENVVADVVFERFVKVENVDGVKLDVTAGKVYPDAHW